VWGLFLLPEATPSLPQNDRSVRFNRHDEVLRNTVTPSFRSSVTTTQFRGSSAKPKPIMPVFAAGEEVVKRQPLMSENDRFWAQVEPVSHKGQMQEGKAGEFGPQLIDSRARRLLLGIGKHP